jgi:uncharacterized membrane protein YczE
MLDLVTTRLAPALRPDGGLRSTPARVRRHPRRDSRHARTAQLLTGLVAVGAGIGMLIRAELGVASWDVLHVGLAGVTGWSVGGTAMVVGLGAAVLAAVLGERPRTGSLVPLAIIGPTIDATMALLGPATDPLGRTTLLAGGVVTLAIGVGAYVTSDHGAGPSDLVFLAIARRGLPIWASRLLVDGTVVAVGWAVGGPVGIGTVVVTLALGPLVGCSIRWFDLAPAREVVSSRHAEAARALGDELAWELG